MNRMKLLASVLAATILLSIAGQANAESWKLGVMIRRAPGGGVEILRVFEGSPAQMMGLQRGHTIVAIDGRLVNDPWAVRDYVMDEDRTRITLIYTDGFSFQEVNVEFGVVAAMVRDGTKYKEVKKLVIKSIKKRSVPDPRKR